MLKDTHLWSFVTDEERGTMPDPNDPRTYGVEGGYPDEAALAALKRSQRTMASKPPKATRIVRVLCSVLGIAFIAVAFLVSMGIALLALFGIARLVEILWSAL